LIFKRHNRMYEQVELWAVPHRHLMPNKQWVDATMYFESAERAAQFAEKHKSVAKLKTVIREL